MSDKKTIPDTMLIPLVVPAGPFGCAAFLPPSAIERLMVQNQPRLLHQATTFVRMGFELDELRVVVDVDESGSLTIESPWRRRTRRKSTSTIWGRTMPGKDEQSAADQKTKKLAEQATLAVVFETLRTWHLEGPAEGVFEFFVECVNVLAAVRDEDGRELQNPRFLELTGGHFADTVVGQLGLRLIVRADQVKWVIYSEKKPATALPEMADKPEEVGA